MIDHHKRAAGRGGIILLWQDSGIAFLFPSLLGVVVEASQRPLNLSEFLLGLCNGGAAVLETLFVVGLVVGARLILVCAKVLDLLARVLDLGKAESGAAAFEEVA